MAKKIGQMRYYGDKATNNNQKNFPSNISRQTLSTGTIFENIFPITQLGI